MPGFERDERIDLLRELLKQLRSKGSMSSDGISEQQLKDFINEGKAFRVYFDPKKDDAINVRTMVSKLWWVIRCLANPREISITIPRIPFQLHEDRPLNKFQLRCWRGHRHATMYRGHVDNSNSCALLLFELYVSRPLSERGDDNLRNQLRDTGIRTDGWKIIRKSVRSDSGLCDVITFEERSTMLFLNRGEDFEKAPVHIRRLLQSAMNRLDPREEPSGLDGIMKQLREWGLPEEYNLPEKQTRELALQDDFERTVDNWPLIGPVKGNKTGIVARFSVVQKRSDWE